MRSENFFKKNKTLLDIIKSYQKEGLNENTSQILAIKKLISSEDPNLQMHYLGEDAFLDSKSYYKKFHEESEKYIPYVEEVLFDREIPSNKKQFLQNLQKNSRIIKRLIAARIKDQNFNWNPSKKIESIKIYKYDSLYKIVQKIKKDSEKNLGMDEIISTSIEIVLNSKDEQFKQLILGENPYLDYILFKNKCNPENINLFIDYFDEVFPNYSHLKKIDKEQGLKKILELSGIERYKDRFIALKLMEEHFSEKGFKIFEDYEKFKKLEEDDEEED